MDAMTKRGGMRRNEELKSEGETARRGEGGGSGGSGAVQSGAGVAASGYSRTPHGTRVAVYGIQGALAKPRSNLLQQLSTAFTLIVAPPHTTAINRLSYGCGTNNQEK